MPGQTVLGGIRKEAERATGNKPVTSDPLCSLSAPAPASRNFQVPAWIPALTSFHDYDMEL